MAQELMEEFESPGPVELVLEDSQVEEAELGIVCMSGVGCPRQLCLLLL